MTSCLVNWLIQGRVNLANFILSTSIRFHNKATTLRAFVQQSFTLRFEISLITLDFLHPYNAFKSLMFNLSIREI